MTNDRDLDGLLDSWLADGPTVVADRVIDDLAVRIARLPQRPAWRLRTWRFPTMSTPFRIVALAASLLAVVLAGVALTGGGKQAPSPTPSASPSDAAPSGEAFVCFGDTTGCAGALAAGPTQTRQFSRPFTFQATAGWTNVRDIPRTYGLEFSGISDGSVPPIEVMSMIAIADQKPDRCEPIPKAGVGSSVDELIRYVQAHPGLVAGQPVAATLDGYRGRRIDFTIAPTWGQICPDADRLLPSVLMLTDTGNPPGRAIAYQSDRRVRWTVLDVGGETVIIEYVDDAVVPTYEADFARDQALIDTIHFVSGG